MKLTIMKLSKENLIDWIDRPPSNSDLDLISYIIGLEKRVKQYENPDNLTLFYMWLDTKIKDKMKQLKDKMKQLEKENKILRENAEHNDKVVDKVNWEINILKNNRDKAIEVINTQLKNTDDVAKDNLRIIKFNLIKGSCTFEDLKTEEDYKYILKGGSDE